MIEGAEETCDEGDEVNGSPNHCNDTCNDMTKNCGDGIVQYGEYCDEGDGPEGHNGEYDHCNSTCTGMTPKCGDGILQREDCTGYANCVEAEGTAEECDEGIWNGALGHCRDNCSGKCGDGKIQRTNCSAYLNCVTVTGADEECDDGANNGQPTYCNLLCSNQTPYCGDGKIQRADCTNYGENCFEVAGFDEECDDGANNGQPTLCNSNCTGTIEHRCGDAILQRNNCTGYENCHVVSGADEECDEGDDFNGTPGHCYSNCSGRCGDGKEQPGEICDHGINNGKPGHCALGCQEYYHLCGDEIWQAWAEACDDGENNGKYNYCTSDCNGYVGNCGDGRIQKATLNECVALTMCSDEVIENCCEVVEFAEGDQSEACDEGFETNGEPGHCNDACSGITE